MFGGSRLSGKGQRVHAWIPVGTDDGELYFKAAGSYVVGSEYLIRVARSGDMISKYPNAVYQRQHEDATRRAELEAAHRAAETRLRLAALERNDKRRSALDDVLRPVEALFTRSSPMDREALLVYVMRRLSRT